MQLEGILVNAQFYLKKSSEDDYIKLCLNSLKCFHNFVELT